MIYTGLGICGLGVLVGMGYLGVNKPNNGGTPAIVERPRKLDMKDPIIQPLFVAAGQFQRLKYGFTPIPQTANVEYESKPRDFFDAMLYIYAKTSRTIAFRKKGDQYVEIREQEIFQGPKKDASPNGTPSETLSLTVDMESIAGSTPNLLKITYSGNDPRLKGNPELHLADIKPVLKEWGY